MDVFSGSLEYILLREPVLFCKYVYSRGTVQPGNRDKGKGNGAGMA